MKPLQWPKAVAKRPTRAALNRRAGGGVSRGVSLIELLVGLVVAMIVGIVALGSAMVFMGQQRQGMGTGGTSVQLGSTLAALKHEVSAAGLGFYGDARYLCNTLNLSAGATLHWNGGNFSPVRITRAAGLDTLDVLQASRVEAGASALLALTTSGADASLKSFLPAAVGDAVLLAPATAGPPCLVRSVTVATAATIDTPQNLVFGAGGLHNAGVFTTNPSYSNEGGSATLLGQLRWQRYRLDGSNLLLEQPLTGASAVLARQVVGMRAQYGVSDGSSDTLDSWQDATGAFASLSAANLPRVRALRVGLLVRSPQAQKPDVGGNCDATVDAPWLFGTQITPPGSDWRCWRYRSQEVVVPMRNLMLGAQP